MIHFVKKEKLYPAFGRAYPEQGFVEIREDLPQITWDFIISHEYYHLKDKAKNWLWREVKANLHAGVRHPIGFVVIVCMSFSKDRLNFYYNRFLRGE